MRVQRGYSLPRIMEEAKRFFTALKQNGDLERAGSVSVSQERYTRVVSFDRDSESKEKEKLREQGS